MRGDSERTRTLNTTHSPAVSVAAVNTIAAAADETWRIRQIHYSYNAAATAGKLTVTIGGSTVYELDDEFAVVEPKVKDFGEFPLQGILVNEEVVVTLAAVTGVTGKVNTIYQ